MPNKKNIILITLIFILFFLVFPLSLQSNFNYSSADVLKLEGTRVIPKGEKISFIHNGTAGYFDEELDSAWMMEIRDGVTLMDDGYINNSREDGTISLINLDGEVELTMSSDGFPFSIGDRLFIIGRDRKQLSEVIDGRIRWNRQFNYVITSMDSSSDNIVVGFMNGSFSVIDITGDAFFDYEPGGSRISLVYSCEISDNSEYLSVVSGLDPQRFILFEKKEMEYKPVYTLNLNSSSKNHVNIFMVNDYRTIFLENSLGYYMIDIIDKSAQLIEDTYRLKNAKYISEYELYMLHTGAVNYNNLKLITRDGRVVLEKGFSGKDVSIKTRNGNLYIIIDGTALKVDIKE